MAATRAADITPTSAPAPTTPAQAVQPRRSSRQPLLVVGTQEGACLSGQFDPVWMQAHDANVLRLVLPTYLIGEGLGCVQQARADGYRVYISVQYASTDSPKQVAAFVQQALATYPNVWAVSVGNEEQNAGVSPAQYASDWAASVPAMKQTAPDAIRVYGEADPWGMGWERESAPTAPPAAQAISVHCYDTPRAGTGLMAVAAQARWAATLGLPLWCSEMAAQTEPTYPYFAVESDQAFAAKVAQVESQAPNLAMVAHYYWPQIGAR